MGFDNRQPVAFHVAMQSLLKHASVPVAVTPLVLETLPISRSGLTPFTWSRWLVPYLCGYQGKALFVDADTLFRADVKELFEIEFSQPIACVPHGRKFERASVMLFNNEQCQQLTPDFVQNTVIPIHKLEWLPTHDLSKDWNHLVGYDQPNPEAKLAHFAQGLPCYQEHPSLWNSEHAQEWRATAKTCVTTAPWETLMGHSVHAPYVKAA